MLKPKPFLYTLSVLLVLAAVLAPGASSAKRFDSRVSIHITPGGIAAYFYGLVRSEKGPCAMHRTMRVLVSMDGTSDFTPFATGIHSNGDGTWTAYSGPGQIHNGYYKAVLAKKAISSGVCKGASSPIFFVD